MVAKKKAVKKAVKKSAVKKPAKKAAKAAKKPAKKPAAKKAPAKKAAPKPVPVQPVTDSTGVVTMKSVDDPGQATEGQAASVKPQLDKETGVLTMVPQSE